MRIRYGLLACALLFACSSDDTGDGDGMAMPAGSHSPPPPGSGCSDEDGGVAAFAFTVAVLPDTQYYSCGYPHIFEAQTEWLASERLTCGLALAVHTGDIVDMNVEGQWDVAATALHRLDGEVPYLLVTGNHDIDPTRASLIEQYFSPDDGAAGDHAPTPFDPGRFDNSYMVVELAGRPWLFLGLEFGPRDEVVAWAGEVLDDHADVPAVIFTHAYLYSDGRRYDRAIQPRQPYHPDAFNVTPEQGINDGEDLWRKLIEPHENVHLVLSGHVIPDGTARSVATRASGTRVHQVLANYQFCDTCPCEASEGGGGYLRLLEFDEAAEQIHVRTYSPYRDESLDDDENDFTLEL